MNREIDDFDLSSGRKWLDGSMVALAVAGLAINGLLLFLRLSGGGITGCGGGPCEDVLSSRWSQIFGVPITVFGGLAYIGLLVSLTPRGRRFHQPLLGVIAGAALWFIFVQAVLLGKFCPWCMTAHGVGISVMVLGSIRSGLGSGFGKVLRRVSQWGAGGLLAIGLAQVYGPVPATYRIDAPAVASPPAVTLPQGAGRRISFDGGKKSYEVSALPILGPGTAKYVLVEYFDYQCPSCHTMAGYMDALLARHPSELAVVLLPVPLDGACNQVVATEDQHPGSCEITRTALAVWWAAPDAFPAYHRALIADPSPASARRLALEIMPPERLEAAIADPWIGDLIRANIADWQVLSQPVNKLPKLLIREKRILHGLPSGEADFIRVMEQELGLSQ